VGDFAALGEGEDAAETGGSVWGFPESGEQLAAVIGIG